MLHPVASTITEEAELTVETAKADTDGDEDELLQFTPVPGLTTKLNFVEPNRSSKYYQYRISSRACRFLFEGFDLNTVLQQTRRFRQQSTPQLGLESTDVLNRRRSEQ